MTPITRYKQDLTREDFHYDPAQEEAVEALQELFDRLVASQSNKPAEGIFGRFLKKKAPEVEQGLYFWGGVGRGKTYLMDTFFDCLPTEKKMRLHFHRFMQMVHQELRKLNDVKNPLEIVGKQISAKAQVLCFDEFFVSDIGDAMLMAGLFKSLKDSVLVVLSIPLATVGGVLAIRIMNVFTFQPMDLLTMIGFIILLGLVVNNAILLVHQTRLGEQDGLTRDEAVEQAIQLRLRPIFMSTLTSIFGMLPLLLMPGAGSVIYRGLAAVIVGGMTVSTIFTLLLLPTLLRMTATKKTVEIKNHHVGGLTPQSAKLDKHSDHL